MAGFNTISLKLKEMYQMITLGGDAELELVDTLDPFAEARVGRALCDIFNKNNCVMF
jgi:structural maintenance of chromosome 4